METMTYTTVKHVGRPLIHLMAMSGSDIVLCGDVDMPFAKSDLAGPSNPTVVTCPECLREIKNCASYLAQHPIRKIK